MSNQSRKHRGYRTQSVVAQYFHEDGSGDELYPHATDAGPGRQGRDVLNVKGWSIEVKARSGFEPVPAMRQAKLEAKEGEIPLVVMRMNGQGEAHIGEWLAITTLADMRELMALRKRYALDQESEVSQTPFQSYLCHVCDNIVPMDRPHTCIPTRSE